ncbi:MAG TPA: circularly permuted type 2 ATP-grasp protein [Steroidobacteraceae bacterium]|nr:circularly permuted type 2 ATP-grasp protein [Steroidobacteraceae bacterium]
MPIPTRPYDEMLDSGGAPRTHCRQYYGWLREQSAEHLGRKRAEADALFHRVGITFAVYGETEGTERLIPFDIVPRILPADEWLRLEAGLKQRVRALNAFIADIYHEQRILRAGHVPAEEILCNPQYRPEMQGVNVPGGIYAHISGIDIVRDHEGNFCVLEDNLRVPSGVSYMLENRKMMMRLFPELFARDAIEPVEHYPDVLHENLKSVAPPGVTDPTVVLLTPGAYNSAYFEHAFLAQQMGIELVEGQDLFVRDAVLYMRTTQGPERVDVVYRRIDDDFLDPLAFRPDSTLGVPGLLIAYRAGHVTIANAIGTGVADDKSIYPYVPDMVRFYLDEQPLLSNVPTWVLRRESDRDYVLANLKDLVVKEVHGAGGYGMLIGPAASAAQLEEFRRRIKAHPARYIAQPTLALSTSPTLVAQGLAPRHIDLRPFVLSGREVTVVPGGLTRVALTDGSLVVNSSQGGGTKDTWVLDEPPEAVAAAAPAPGSTAS